MAGETMDWPDERSSFPVDRRTKRLPRISEKNKYDKYVLALSVWKRSITYSSASLAIASLMAAGCASVALAQSAGAGGGTGVITPSSSVSSPADVGQRAHTNIQFLAAPGNNGSHQFHGPPFPGLFYEDPASIACVYNLQPQIPGCNPNYVSLNPVGGRKAIAVVDAYDDPDAYADLQGFTAQFGVAPINPSSFIVVYAASGGALPGSCTGAAAEPPVDPTGGWELEESLDIEWSHAMAPQATVYLVEAQSDLLSDLFCAVTVANGLLQKAGGGEVSMSWGTGEFSGENTLDSLFTAPGVVYFASSGDSAGVIYPSASPNVVSAGGTTLSRNPINGSFIGENGWQIAGGGPSAYESRPSYQNSIAYIVGNQRGTPDVSLDSNPNTGVWVLDNFLAATTCGGTPCWYVVGGTSVASPTWAGLVNAAGNFSGSTNAELARIYRYGGFGFNDITLGSCGLYMGYFASPGWDFCTGFGSPSSYYGK